jgi:hypothetical protein
MSRPSTAQTDQSSVTPIAQWRRSSEGVIVTLPSGKSARVRSVGLDTFVAYGEIPDFLTPTVVELFNNGFASLPEFTGLQMIKQYIVLLDLVCEMAFVEPKVVRSNPGENEIELRDIELGDKASLLGLLGLPVNRLSSFRPKEVFLMEDVADAEVQPGESEHLVEPVGMESHD